MIVFCLFAVLSMLASAKLPETLNKTPPDFIQELSDRMSMASESMPNDIIRALTLNPELPKDRKEIFVRTSV